MKKTFALILLTFAACNSERMPEKRGPGEGFAWPSEAAPASGTTPDVPSSPAARIAQPAAPTAPTPPTAAPAAPPTANLHLGRPIAITPARKKLIFQDDFNRAQLGPDWKFESGDWQIKDNAAHSTKTLNKCLWLTKPMPADAVVELEAASMSPRGDVKFAVFGDGLDHESGYSLIFGGWFNTISVISRGDEHAQNRKERHDKGAVTPGKRHKFEMRRVGGRIDWHVDGALYLSYDDAQPFRGAGHDRFAFCNWESPVHYDNLRIYEILPEAAGAASSNAGDALAPAPQKPAAPLPMLKLKRPLPFKPSPQPAP